MVLPLLIVLLTSVPSYAWNEQEEIAIREAGNAAYKQLGLELAINTFFEDRVPKDYKIAFSRFSPVAMIIIKRRLELKWNF